MRKPTGCGVDPHGLSLSTTRPFVLMPASVAYFIHLNQQTTGPFSEDEVRAKFHAGEIKEDTLVAKEGSAQWTPLSKTILSESKIQLETDSAAATSGNLQFDRAEFAQPKSGAVTCSVCQQAVRDSYFHINGLVACATCKDRIETSGAGRITMKGFGKSALFGVGAAIAGAVIWYAVSELTHTQWGLIGIVIGLMVGVAVRKGSRGWGGWQYQTLAMALTYFAIAATYVPWLLKGNRAEGHEDSLPFMMYLFAYACVVPFLLGFRYFMGWIIIGIALYQAWKINRRVPLKITGPYKIAPTPSAT
jgi:hypothetical protein